MIVKTEIHISGANYGYVLLPDGKKILNVKSVNIEFKKVEVVCLTFTPREIEQYTSVVPIGNNNWTVYTDTEIITNVCSFEKVGSENAKLICFKKNKIELGAFTGYIRNPDKSLVITLANGGKLEFRTGLLPDEKRK